MKVLVLGDTRDATCLASKLEDSGDHKVVAAGALNHEDADRLADYFTRVGCDVVVDASHPFVDGVSHCAAKACRTLGIKRLRVSPPPWQAADGDIWSEVGSLDAAADALTRGDDRVYLKVDPRNMAAFADIPPRVWFLVRLEQGPLLELPLRNCGIIVDPRDPTVDSERELITTHGITRLICENAGDELGYPALTAAREMRVPVILVRQPRQPDGERAEGVDEAISWLQAVG